MNQPRKSTVEEIRQRFDADVERFSNLESGQSATIDAPLVLDVVAAAVGKVTPQAKRLLDVGCGAGNYTLKLLAQAPFEELTLVDLSQPMLERAGQRIAAISSAKVNLVQGDIREIPLPAAHYDVIVAAAVLHHLREEQQWRDTFARLYDSLRPGGWLWIADLIEHSTTGIQTLMWDRYGEYLRHLGGDAYREKVYAYVAQEDSPRPLMFQLDLLRAVGFREVEVLHKNSVFAAFGAVK